MAYRGPSTDDRWGAVGKTTSRSSPDGGRDVFADERASPRRAGRRDDDDDDVAEELDSAAAWTNTTRPLVVGCRIGETTEEDPEPNGESVWSRLCRFRERVYAFGKKTKAAGNSKLDAADIRVLINRFRSRMDVFDEKLTAIENPKLDADEQHAPSSSGRDRRDDDDGRELDRHGAAALTDDRPRTTRPDGTARKTRNSKRTVTNESIWLRLRRLEERANRIGGKTKTVGNSKRTTGIKPGVMHRLKSRVYAFGKKMKGTGNSELYVDNTCALLNQFKSRLDAFGDKLTALEKSKRPTKNECGLMNRLKSLVYAFGKKTKAAGNSKPDTKNDRLRIDDSEDSVA